jgi:hypothetical protein
VEDVGCGALFGDAAGVEHGDVVGEAVDDAEVVADEEHGEAAAGAEFIEEGEDLSLDGHI